VEPGRAEALRIQYGALSTVRSDSAAHIPTPPPGGAFGDHRLLLCSPSSLPLAPTKGRGSFVECSTLVSADDSQISLFNHDAMNYRWPTFRNLFSGSNNLSI